MMRRFVDDVLDQPHWSATPAAAATRTKGAEAITVIVHEEASAGGNKGRVLVPPPIVLVVPAAATVAGNRSLRWLARGRG